MNQPITINPNRIDLDEAYMQMAEVWARRSKANRKQVGALIVKDRQIISDGYNGMPAGDVDDSCEVFDGTGLITKPEVLHAESNALAKIAENGGVGAQGATLYVTMSPCKECAKLIKQAKIKRVVFREHYRDDGGISFLTSRGVTVEQLGNAVIATTASPANPAVEIPVAPPPPPPILSQASSQMRSLAAVAAPKPAPTPVAAAPVPVMDDLTAALAEAGITLVNGVPVEKAAPSPAAKKPAEDGTYRSSFL